MANEKRLIDANALIAYFEEQYNLAMDDPDPVSGYVMAALRCCTEHFKTIPTVDAVEVVHARWENVQSGKGCCSNCHRLDGIDNLATHCRYCGAKMDGGNEE